MQAVNGGEPIRVVLADDEAMLRRGLRLLLESSGTIRVVAEAGDGHELLAAVRAHSVDVALIDVQMPGKDGLSALRDLTSLPDRPAAAVLTTFDLDDYVSDALRYGANGFLLKDADPAVLVRAVHDLAAGGAVLDPRITARLLPRFRGATDNAHEVQLVRGLSARERQVLELLSDGRSNADIGMRLGLTEATVKSYVSTVLSKLGAQNRVQAALIAQRVAGAGDRW
ncbi:two component transcriptional regulator, LuxR family [Saccharopolyspora kobensis]|uniref:Two component transcriptional regulator, LuxR family n=1 Tax=Saccharopolyspora kobensis TaxID=146035 RepID=A0A1H6AXG3_9PSEU|nr:response regulator transcription factor [Saccharopolyspora kobensis]SEG52960.1 two component transcriptional regulator, LuxR family [Saccharopolyspora kobensis]SFE80698.1 two component transcriptional regulator, LuxR family [Saccharopolyspora kobensis]